MWYGTKEKPSSARASHASCGQKFSSVRVSVSVGVSVSVSVSVGVSVSISVSVGVSVSVSVSVGVSVSVDSKRYVKGKCM